MIVEPILAGIFDPRGTLTRDRARRVVDAALAPHGPPSIVQAGPITVGVAGRGSPDLVAATGSAVCALEGRLLLRGEHGGGEAIEAPALAAAWSRDRDAMLPAARGAFSVLLWDERLQRGLVARDQVGQRPLLWQDGQRLSFAGEFRPLLALLDPHPAPDEVAVACWLGSVVPRGGRTLFEGVRRLPPGHQLDLRDGRWAVNAYWRPRFREPEQRPWEDHLAGIRTELNRATAATLEGANAPGVLLSGGLDSSTVAAVAAPLARSAGTPLRAYSATFPGLDAADEAPFIDENLDTLNLSGSRMEVMGGSLLAGSLAYVRAWGMPDLSANTFFWIDLLKHAAGEGVDVLLDGEGGDEVFKTPYYLIADRLRSGAVRDVRRLLEHFPNIAQRPSKRLRGELLLRFGIAGLMPYGVHRAAPRLRPAPSPLELTRRAARLSRAEGDPWSWKDLDGPRWWAHVADGIVYGPDGIGAAEHALRVARSAGIRRGRPLRDLDLSEHMMRLPPGMAFSPWFDRGQLRAAMEGALSQTVVLRRHKSFFTDVRIRSLIESDLLFARRLLGPDAEVRRYVTDATIAAAIADPAPDAPEERGLWGFRVQHLAATELWLRSLSDSDFPQRLLDGDRLDPPRTTIRPQGAAAH